MRDLMNLMESYLGGESLVEDVLECNVPGEVIETRQFNGLTFNRQEGGMHNGFMWFVYRGVEVVGAFAEDWRHDGLVIHCDLHPQFTRQGFGTIVYDFADTLAAERGLKVMPAYLQSPEAKRFWEKRRMNESIQPDVIQQILSDRRVRRGVKVSPKATFWRGESEEGGSGFATYGQGFYFTCDKSYAKQYGDVSPVSATMLPDNALRFDTINDWQIWKQTAMKLLGFNDARDFAVHFDDVREFIRSLDPSIDGLQLFTGKDAIFVLYDA